MNTISGSFSLRREAVKTIFDMRTTKIFATALFGVLLFLAGMMTGAHVGPREFAMQEASVKATLLVSELRLLRAGQSQKLIQNKEIALDGEIVKALAFRESGSPWLFWPLNPNYEHSRYLRAVAAYRAEHPPMVPQLPVAEQTPMTDDMKSFALQVRDRTQELLRDYGK